MMCPGVSKSGSPWESPMMSRPAARSSRVRWAEDAEAEIFARPTRLERKATLGPGMRTEHGKVLTMKRGRLHDKTTTAYVLHSAFMGKFVCGDWLRVSDYQA